MIDWDAMLPEREVQAPAVVPDPSPWPPAPDSQLPGVRSPERRWDNRRRCSECACLADNGRCLAAAKRLIVASRGYTPDRDMLRRCEGFMALPDDPDQRQGRDRWPGLISDTKPGATEHGGT